MQKEVKVNPQETLNSLYSYNLLQPKPAPPYKIVLVDDNGKEFFILPCNKKFNWLQRKMFKLLLGFEIKENKE